MHGTTLRLRLPLVAATAALGLAGLVSVGPAAVAATTGVPYTDPNAVGVVGLCDRSGHQITHGTLAATPFAWRAVSSVAAQGPYAVAGRTATLYAYQPRQDVPAGDWSGTQLTASARYTDIAHPMAAATSGDSSLAQFTGEFAPSWDGLLQLRIFLGAPNQEINSLTYPATTIKVTGQTWQVVNPTAVPCGTGTSTSIESILLPNTKGGSTAKPGHDAGSSASPGPGAPSTAAATTPPVDPSSPAVAPSATGVALAGDSTARGSGGHGVEIGVGAAVVAALIAGGFVLGRRSSTSRSAG